jgi:hypothetical protein
MREVVVDILTGENCPGDEALAAPDDEGTDAVAADEATSPQEAPCPGVAAGTPPAPDVAADGDDGQPSGSAGEPEALGERGGPPVDLG